jgi:hypothetical protein
MIQTPEKLDSNLGESANILSTQYAPSGGDVQSLPPAITDVATHSDGGNRQAPAVSANNDSV